MFLTVAAFHRSVASYAGRTTVGPPLGFPVLAVVLELAWDVEGGRKPTSHGREVEVTMGTQGAPACLQSIPAPLPLSLTPRPGGSTSILVYLRSTQQVLSRCRWQEISFICCSSCIRDTEFRPQNLLFFFFFFLSQGTAIIWNNESCQDRGRELAKLWAWAQKPMERKGKFTLKKNSLAENECSVHWDAPSTQRAA